MANNYTEGPLQTEARLQRSMNNYHRARMSNKSNIVENSDQLVHRALMPRASRQPSSQKRLGSAYIYSSHQRR